MSFSLTYVYHDCFLMETERLYVLFDYWKDPLATRDTIDFPPLLDEIVPEKPIYIVVSHHHKDHFSRRIFKWGQRLSLLQFIISKDVYKSVKYMLREGGNYTGYRPPLDKIHVLTPGEEFRDENIFVKAYPSTDTGNSYAIETGGLKIFHAGDLNAWLWLDESTKIEIEEGRRNFINIVESIRHDYPAFDVAMFPVDSRLGTQYWWGAGYFVSVIACSLFLPMHFELAESDTEKERRRIDAAAFQSFARKDFGEYLQLGSSRSKYYKN